MIWSQSITTYKNKYASPAAACQGRIHHFSSLFPEVYLYQIPCLFDLVLQTGRHMPCGVGLNIAAHVPPFERKKAHGLQFTVPCAFRLLF